MYEADSDSNPIVQLLYQENVTKDGLFSRVELSFSEVWLFLKNCLLIDEWNLENSCGTFFTCLKIIKVDMNLFFNLGCAKEARLNAF